MDKNNNGNIIMDQLEYEHKERQNKELVIGTKEERLVNKLSKICNDFGCNSSKKTSHVADGVSAFEEMKNKQVEASKGSSNSDTYFYKRPKLHEVEIPFTDEGKQKLVVDTSRRWHEQNTQQK